LLLKLSDEGIESRPFTASAGADTTAAVAKEAPVAPPKPLAEREKFHLYLLVGQSNMAGRGTIEGVDLSINPRVLSLDPQDRWVVAMDPLHNDKPGIAGVGLGTTFGKVMAEENPDVVIGLIPCAVGGTSIGQWAKGAPPVGNWGKLYENAIRRAKIAQRDGVIKGILWHQGEADSSPTKIAAYQESLTKLVANFRADLECPDASFVAGMLGVWDPQRHASRKAFNDNLAGLPDWFAKAAVVDSSELPHRGDNTHFSSAALREFGRRYAAALQGLR
jgi:pimeloyl-ACP methyl ester carboxylesterase